MRRQKEPFPPKGEPTWSNNPARKEMANGLSSKMDQRARIESSLVAQDIFKSNLRAALQITCATSVQTSSFLRPLTFVFRSSMEAKAFAFFSHVFNSVSKCGRVSLLFSMNCKASACAVFAYEWLKWICVLLRGFGLGQFTNRKSNLPRYFPYSYRFVFFGHFLEFSGL